MFDHDDIATYTITEVPLDRDIYLMDEIWMADYAAALRKCLSGGDFDRVGYISYAAARQASAAGIELSWYPNIHTRFHEMRVHLPASAFVSCVECWIIDEKPRIFVRTNWLTDLHLRTYSVFAMVDAIGVKAALAAGNLTTARLDDLRDRIDAVSAKNPDIAFVSFADSLLLKSNWSVGQWDSEVSYTYEPERILRVLPEIVAAYDAALGLPVYAVVTQGRNEFYRDELMHVSASRNHVSLNSLGLPFAQLQAIESAARSAIRVGDHDAAELYMDSNFFHSLNWRQDFEKHQEPKSPYLAPMAAYPCEYRMMSIQRAIGNLKT